jgi:hypothetical protein
VEVVEEHLILLDKLLVVMADQAVVVVVLPLVDLAQEQLAQFKDTMVVLELMMVDQLMLQAVAVAAQEVLEEILLVQQELA